MGKKRMQPEEQPARAAAGLSRAAAFLVKAAAGAIAVFIIAVAAGAGLSALLSGFGAAPWLKLGSGDGEAVTERSGSAAESAAAVQSGKDTSDAAEEQVDDAVPAPVPTPMPFGSRNVIISEYASKNDMYPVAAGAAEGMAGSSDAAGEAEANGSAGIHTSAPTGGMGSKDRIAATGDYIELYNRGTADADLSGWTLADGSDRPYTFPAGTLLQSGAYLAVPCAGEGAAEGTAPFGLRAEGGETLTLKDAEGRFMDEAVTVPLQKNRAACRTEDGGFAADTDPSPGFENSPAGVEQYLEPMLRRAEGLVISEVLPENTALLYHENYGFTGLVELTNTTDQPITLEGLYLTDDLKDPAATALTGTLEKGACLLLFERPKGMAAPEGARDLLTFGLSGQGETLYITDRFGTVTDSFTFGTAEENRSFVRNSRGEVVLTDDGTPGYGNDAAGYGAFQASCAPKGPLVISEVCPSNRSRHAVGEQYYDMVELYNRSREPVDLTGYRLAKKNAAAGAYTLPKRDLGPGEYLLICCSGDESLQTEKQLHAPFKLNAASETLYLVDGEGRLADYLWVRGVPSDGSMGRTPDLSGTAIYTTPTLGKANGSGGQRGMASEMPVSDVPGGIYDGKAFTVTLSAPGKIYYTTDGSLPEAGKDREYKGPLEISKTTVLRAVSLEEGKKPGAVLNLTFIVNEGHELPVVSVVLEPSDYEGKNGINNHPMENWQKQAHFTLFDGERTVESDMGMSVTGQGSRKRPHKSFKLDFSGGFSGNEALNSRLFEASDKTRFTTLTLRAGLDSKYAVIKEGFLQTLAAPYRDTMLAQYSRLCVVYINGEYQGIYYLAEDYTKDWGGQQLGVDPDTVEIIKGKLYDKTTEIYKLMDYIKKHDMSDPAHYAYAEARLDMVSFADWCIFQVYGMNHDHPGNIRYIRSTEGDGRYRIIYYDMECSFPFSAKESVPDFELVTEEGQTRYFLNNLMENETFFDLFMTRLAYHCQNTFAPEYAGQVLADLMASIESEVERDFARWNLDVASYRSMTGRMVTWIRDTDRPKQLIDSACKVFKLTSAQKEHYFGEYLHRGA